MEGNPKRFSDLYPEDFAAIYVILESCYLELEVKKGELAGARIVLLDGAETDGDGAEGDPFEGDFEGWGRPS